ncbi:ABC-2 family transporter protein [Planctomycetes bacterium Pla163]|uniref:ABC-2 family transporter protein n=1 Tax=Rohdeia mirabilis TaxID=2528008 RepID=A0A518CY39_9BACT|nr:ABC-2 family transporter protein [Planctomycetes bacterium Pla163]
MIGAIARHELVRLARDRRFRTLAGLLLVLLLAAMSSAWLDATERADQREAASHAVHDTWLDQGEKNPHSATHFGTWTFLPLSQLSFLDPGATAYSGVATFVESHTRGARSRGETVPAPLRSPSGMAQVLLPLLIVLVGFDVLAGERDRGTLAHLVGLGANPRALVVGKALGLVAAVLLALVPAAIAAAVLLLLPPGADTLRSLGFGAAQLAHAVLWCLVVVGLSGLMPTARASLVAGLALWGVTALLVPRLAADAASRAVPLPSPRALAASVAAELSEIGSAHDPTSPAYAELKAQVLAEHAVDDVADLPFNFAGWVLQRGEELESAVYAKSYGDLDERHATQEDVLDGFAWISPRIALGRTSASMAGTDRRHLADWDASVETFRAHMVRTLNDVLTYDERASEPGFAVGRETWEQVGTHRYVPRSAGWALAGVRTSALQIAVQLLLALALVGLAADRIARRPGSRSDR